jgi:hypothetical protein
VITELQEQLLAWDRGLDSRDGAIIAWEERVIAFALSLGEVSAERDASCARVDAVWRDFSTKVCASHSRFGQLTALSRGRYWT